MIVVDTGPIVAFVDNRDNRHAVCRDLLLHAPGRLLGCHCCRIVLGKFVQVLCFGCSCEAVADSGCSASTICNRRDEWIIEVSGRRVFFEPDGDVDVWFEFGGVGVVGGSEFVGVRQWSSLGSVGQGHVSGAR